MSTWVARALRSLPTTLATIRVAAAKVQNAMSPIFSFQLRDGKALKEARVEEMKNPYFIGEQAGGTQTSGWLGGWISAPSAYAVPSDTRRRLLPPSTSLAITIFGSLLKGAATATRARQTPRILF